MDEIRHEFELLIYSRNAFDRVERAKELVDYVLTQPRFAPARATTHDLYSGRASQWDEQMDRSLDKLVPNVERPWSECIFERSRYPSCKFIVIFGLSPSEPFSISNYRTEERFVRKAVGLEDWLDFASGLLYRHQAWYAAFYLSEEWHAKNYLAWRALYSIVCDRKETLERKAVVGSELEKCVPGVYWGNYFGPFYVDWFGREKFEDLPCVEKLWLDGGGIFFTTASTPFDWNTNEARQLQQAVKEHLGQNAFFDCETVLARVRQLEPIPRYMEPEQFQSPRRLPDFPFTIDPTYSQPRPLEEQLADARQTFESHGYTLIEEDECTLLFRDESGGKLRVTVGEGGSIEFLPQQ